MSDITPPVERLLDMLATLCRDALLGTAPAVIERSGPILRALSRSGYSRVSGASLADELEWRIVAKTHCLSPGQLRAIAQIAQALQQQFDAQRPVWPDDNQ